MENKIVPITNTTEDQQDLKDLMTSNILQGLIPDGFQDKIPSLLQAFAPQAYDGIKGKLKDGDVRYMLYFDNEYGIILQRLDMTKDTTKIEFADPTAEEVIIIQKKQNGITVIQNGEEKDTKDLLSSLMSTIGGKLF